MKYLIALSAVVLLAFQLPTKAKLTATIISGVVVDESGMPLIGANVLEVGTNNGVVTDFDGLFTLHLSTFNTSIEISYTGYESQKIKVGTQKYLKVTMQSGQLLDEIVLTGIKNHRAEKSKNYVQTTSGSPQVNYEYKDNEGSPENYKYFEDNQFKNTLDEPLSTMSIDVDRASYSNIRRHLNMGVLPPKDAVRTEEMINYFDYNYAGPIKNSEHPFMFYNTLTSCPWNNDHQILHITLKAKEMSRAEIPPSNFVFLLDVSGSMNQANKLPLLKESFKLLVNQMNENDKVSIVVYAGAAGTIIDGISGNDKAAIIEALDNLRAGGSTAGAAGITRAYQLARKHFITKGNNRVILATDGDFNVGVSSEGDLVRMIEKERNSGVFLSILGFGMGNYQDNKMQELSNKGNGNHFYIDNIDEAKKSLITEFGGSLYTVAKDVKFQIEFNPEKVAGYRIIGYENRQLENRDFNDDTKDAGELGAGHTVTVIYEVIPQGIKSEFLTDIEPLKYTDRNKKYMKNSEIATLKCRYKPIDSDKSVKVELKVGNSFEENRNTNNAVEWSLVVSEFGLLLRDSPYKSNANYTSVLERAQKLDSDKYRKECIELIKKAQSLGDIVKVED